MAAAFFNELSRRAAGDSEPTMRAMSAGTSPAARVHPEVVAAMREVEIDLTAARPQKLTAELAQSADLLVTMGCGDKCPYVPGLQVEDWPLDDPKGQPIERVREIRDEIRRRVTKLLNEPTAFVTKNNKATKSTKRT